MYIGNYVRRDEKYALFLWFVNVETRELNDDESLS